MHRIKATDLIALRRIVSERDAQDQEEFLRRLDPETRARYESALPSEWHPAESICHLHTAAADVLYPADRAPLTRLGLELASRSFATVYRRILSVPSFSFVVRRAGVVWSWYHSEGTCTVEDQQDTSMRVVVRGAPELPAPLTEVIAGHILALGHATKTRNVRARVESRNPEAWTWHCVWDLSYATTSDAPRRELR